MADAVLGADLSQTHSPGQTTRWDDPLQALVRVACSAVMLFQAQGAVSDLARYHEALEAVWMEAVGLDQDALAAHLPAADASMSLWALVMVCVICRPSATRFDRLIDNLLTQLEVTRWGRMRPILTDFFYPAFYLDQNDTAARFFSRFRPPSGDGAG